MLYLYIYLILKTDNAAWSVWVSQNLPWVGWRDVTISQIEGARARVGGGERERGRALCNPYYMTPRTRELFKKLFVVLFLEVSFGDGMRATGPILWQIMWFQLRGWRLKIGELWFPLSKDVKWRDLDRKERVSDRERKTEESWCNSHMPSTCILKFRQANISLQHSESAFLVQNTANLCFLPYCGGGICTCNCM